MYIFVRFISSLLNPWFWFYLNGLIIINRLIGDWFYYIDEMGYINSVINRVGFVAGKIEIGVLVVLVLVLILVKLFLKRYLICPELNSPLVAIYSLILSSVYFIRRKSH